MWRALQSELGQLRGVLVWPLAAWFVLAFVFIAAPLPRLGGTASEWAITRIERDLIPQGVAVVSLTPLDPFAAQTTAAAVLAFFVAAPLLAFKVWRYVSPGLYPRERRGLLAFLILSFVLMAAGAAFAYTVLIPVFFKGLAAFSVGGVGAYYSLLSLMSLISSIVVCVAVTFLLPVGMAVLSAAGLVRPAFWLRYARHAVLLTLAVSAIIAPDNTGIGMVLLALPVCLLYCGGYIGSVLLYPRAAYHYSQH